MTESKREDYTPPEERADVLIQNEPQESTLEYQGQTIRIKHVPISRGARNSASEAAALAYRKKFGKDEAGMLPSVFERELASIVIKSWNIPERPSLAWDKLPVELGDQIAELIGINEAMESFKIADTEEAKRAKNS